MPGLALGFAAGFGIPRWVLKFLRGRREKKFLEALPDAVDIIVRGIKAGLPLLDSMRMVANEGQEPAQGRAGRLHPHRPEDIRQGRFPWW